MQLLHLYGDVVCHILWEYCYLSKQSYKGLISIFFNIHSPRKTQIISLLYQISNWTFREEVGGVLDIVSFVFISIFHDEYVTWFATVTITIVIHAQTFMSKKMYFIIAIIDNDDVDLLLSPSLPNYFSNK